MGTRTMRWFAVLFVVAFGAASCSNDTSPKADVPKSGTSIAGSDTALFGPSVVNKPVHDGTPRRGGTITFGLEGDVLNLSPNQSMIQPPDVQVGSAVYDPLISFDAKGLPITDNTDHQANQLADSLTSSPDLTTWTVKLRHDVKFANGVALDAQQVVDHTKWVKSSGTCDCDADARNIAEVTADGPDTVTYRLADPVVDFPTKLNRGGLAWITESGARNAAPDPSAPDLEHLVGTGAFRFESRSGDSYTVVANENYYGVDPANDGAKLPYLDKIVFKPLADSVTRLQAVQSGGVQIMQTADTANLVEAKKDPRLRVQPAQGTSSTILGLNLTREPFGVTPKAGETAQQTAIRALDDPTALAARQAFNLALNRNEINQKSYQGTRVPAYAFIPENNPWYDPKAQLPRHDVAKATRLVDSVRKAGVSTDILALCINASQATDMFQLVQQQLGTVGFEATLKPVEQAILVQNLLGGSGDIAWNVACFRAPQLADPNGLTNTSTTGGATNFVKYSRTDVDHWMEQGRQTADPAARKKLYDQVQEQMAADVVYLPTLFDYYGNVFTKGLSGLSAPSPVSLGIITPGTLYRTA